jgi:hypothetical protein
VEAVRFSRKGTTMIRNAIWLGVLALALAGGDRAAAQEREVPRKDLVALLSQTVDTQEFTQEQTLKQFLARLQAKVKTKDRELPLWVNAEAFKEEAGDVPDLGDVKVAAPPYPKKMTVAALLRHALAKSGLNASYLVKHGVVEITTLERTRVQYRLNEVVEGKFDSQQLGDVLEELAAQAGVTLAVDPRLGNQMKTLVSANFTTSETALGTALNVLTDMAGLRVVVVDNVLYVTHPLNAQQFPDQVQGGTYTPRAAVNRAAMQ